MRGASPTLSVEYATLHLMRGHEFGLRLGRRTYFKKNKIKKHLACLVYTIGNQYLNKITGYGMRGN